MSILHMIRDRPYGELGSVEKKNVCCCVGFTSNLSPSNPEGGGPTPIIPGDCCETALVNEIVHELKLRYVRNSYFLMYIVAFWCNVFTISIPQAAGIPKAVGWRPHHITPRIFPCFLKVTQETVAMTYDVLM